MSISRHTRNQPDFEQLSDGDWRNITHMPPPLVKLLLLDHPYRTCPYCEGTGIGGLLIAETHNGIILGGKVPCGCCDGAGKVEYVCFN